MSEQDTDSSDAVAAAPEGTESTRAQRWAQVDINDFDAFFTRNTPEILLERSSTEARDRKTSP
jgi:hypothetical protein